MREYLFRGKRKDTGEWVEGYLFRIWSKAYILWGTTNGIPDMVEVDPETVGQYIGMRDKKNGKRIFEGDIVKFVRINALGCVTNRIGIVRHYDKLPIFFIMATTGDAWDWCECKEIEVIGNVYDDKELLEV